jgi:hypothetical protein
MSILSHVFQNNTFSLCFDEAPSFLGKGLYGRVFCVKIDGTKFALKITADADSSLKFEYNSLCKIAQSYREYVRNDSCVDMPCVTVSRYAQAQVGNILYSYYCCEEVGSSIAAEALEDEVMEFSFQHAHIYTCIKF